MAGFEDVISDLVSANKRTAATGPTKYQQQVALDTSYDLSLGETFARGAQAGALGLKTDLNYFAALGNSLIGDFKSASADISGAALTSLSSS